MKIFIGEIMSCNLNYQPNYIACELIDNFEITETVEKADIIVFPGTCSCTKENILFSLNYISSILKRKKSNAKTYMTGCLTRKFINSELFDIEKWLNEHIDFIIPQNEPNLLLQQISQEKFGNRKREDFGLYTINQNNVGTIYISNGCLNNCSFCKTTFQKLPLKSADIDEVKNVISEFDKREIKKIILKGTNVSQYGLDLNGTYMLPLIIDCIESTKSIRELDLIGFAFKDAIHNDFSYVFKNSSKLRGISGALESGSDRLLDLMRKGFTSKEIIKFIETISKKYPKELILNIIAGFPTENIEDIKLTLEVLKLLNPSTVDICRYTNSKFVDSNKYPQLSPTEIENHTRIYQKVLSRRKVNTMITGKSYINN